MRIVAILTSYNEERFIGHVLEHYLKNGIEVYLLDNESTDNTVDIAQQYLDKNLIKIESVPRHGEKEWSKLLTLKCHLAENLGADWYIHADPDEFRVSCKSEQTLYEAILDVDRQGYNAINFMEFTFVPTREEPDHDHPAFLQTMKHYYPFLPNYPNRLNAWKQPPRHNNPLKKAWKVAKRKSLDKPIVDLSSSGGHKVRFKGLNQFPLDFKMRHYIALSEEHMFRKYVKVNYRSAHPGNWRGDASEDSFTLPSNEQLSFYTTDDALNAENPRKRHVFVMG